MMAQSVWWGAWGCWAALEDRLLQFMASITWQHDSHGGGAQCTDAADILAISAPACGEQAGGMQDGKLRHHDLSRQICLSICSDQQIVHLQRIPALTAISARCFVSRLR